jgi:addiction module RelB/DinJ family antitoxin
MRRAAFITLRIEPTIKREAARVLAKLGLSTSEAITVFLSQVALHKGLPFKLTHERSNHHGKTTPGNRNRTAGRRGP